LFGAGNLDYAIQQKAFVTDLVPSDPGDAKLLAEQRSMPIDKKAYAAKYKKHNGVFDKKIVGSFPSKKIRVLREMAREELSEDSKVKKKNFFSFRTPSIRSLLSLKSSSSRSSRR